MRQIPEGEAYCRNCRHYQGNKTEKCVAHNRYNEITKELDRGKENKDGNCEYYEVKESFLSNIINKLQNA